MTQPTDATGNDRPVYEYEMVTVYVTKSGSAHEYRPGPDGKPKGLRRIVDLRTRERLYAYIAQHERVHLHFMVGRSNRKRIGAKIEALGFKITWWEGWEDYSFAHATAVRNPKPKAIAEPAERHAPAFEVPAATHRDYSLCETPPNRATRRDVRSVKKARAAWRATKRAGRALW